MACATIHPCRVQHRWLDPVSDAKPLFCGVQTLRVPTSITEQEEVQVEVTRLLVECYFDIVRANLQVPPLLTSPSCSYAV